MSRSVDDPHCPECGEPIGQTATYCMHCSADLTDRQLEDGRSDSWGSESADSGQPGYIRESSGTTAEDQILHPEGIVDNTLTALVGIVSGLIIGIGATVSLSAFIWNFLWGLPLGIVVWLAATGYLVRRSTVQAAMAHGCFGIVLAFLSIPLTALSPFAPIEDGISGRIAILVSWGVIAGFFAVIAGVVGAIAYVLIPDEDGEETDAT